jgi:hypothetical protein
MDLVGGLGDVEAGVGNGDKVAELGEGHDEVLDDGRNRDSARREAAD